MNKKQLNTLSASLSKALSPPSRKKIELSARIIDQVQPLPSIVSSQPSSESAHDAPPQHRGRTPASESNKERIRSEIRSPERLSLGSTDSGC